jgi:hypothetical protein
VFGWKKLLGRESIYLARLFIFLPSTTLHIKLASRRLFAAHILLQAYKGLLPREEVRKFLFWKYFSLKAFATRDSGF